MIVLTFAELVDLFYRYELTANPNTGHMRGTREFIAAKLAQVLSWQKGTVRV